MDEKEKRATATRGDIDRILNVLEDYKHYQVKTLQELDRRVSRLEIYAKILSGGVTVTIAGIAAFAFWFGGLRTTVSDAAIKTDRVYGIVLENSDSLSTRTRVIETQLKQIDEKLTIISNQQRGR